MSRRKPKSTRNSPALTESVGLATIADHLPYHIYLKDRSRRFIWANPAMLKACGCTLEQLKRLRDEDLFEGPHLKEAIADDEIVIKQGAIVLDRLEFETWKPGRGSGTGAATGNVRRLGLVLTTKKPIREGNGKIVGLIGVTRDYGVELPEFLRKSDYPWDLRSLSSGVYYHNLTTGEQWRDDKFQHLFPDKGLRGRWEHLCEEDRERVKRFLQRLSKPKRRKKATVSDKPITSTIDFRADIADEQRWIRGTAIAFRSGEDWVLLVGHQDVSEEKQRESLSARALLSLTDQVYVFVKDPQKRFCYMNASFLRALGWELREVINRTDKDLGFPDQQIAVFRKNDDAILQGKDKGPVMSVDEHVTTRAGRILTLMTMKMPLESEVFDPGWAASGKDSDGVVGHHILGIAWDMDRYEPGEKEALLRGQTANSAWMGLLNHSTDAIYLKTAQGNYLTINEAFARIVGKSRDQIVGRTTAEVFADKPDLLETILLEDQILINREKPITEALRERVSSDGGTTYESSVKLAIGDSDGAVQYILGVSRNITSHMPLGEGQK